MSDRYERAEEMARAEQLDELEAEIERLQGTVRDLLDELEDQGVDTVHHPARAVLDNEGRTVVNVYDVRAAFTVGRSDRASIDVFADCVMETVLAWEEMRDAVVGGSLETGELTLDVTVEAEGHEQAAALVEEALVAALVAAGERMPGWKGGLSIERLEAALIEG